MKKFIILLSVLLVVGHLLTYLSPVMAQLWPDMMSKKANLFIHGGVSMQYWWYVKFSADDLLWVITFFCLAMATRRYSIRLFMISCVFLIYHAIDAFMFWYNYKSGKFGERLLIVCVILSVATLLIPLWKAGKYKSMI